MRLARKLIQISILTLCFAFTNTALAAIYDLFNAAGTMLPVETSDAGFTLSSITATGLVGSAFDNHFYFIGWEAALNQAKYMALTVSHVGVF